MNDVDNGIFKQDPLIDHDGFPAAAGRPRHDCGEIFRKFGQEYERTHDMTAKQRRVLRAVASCRTEALGGHWDRCGSCGHEEASYNSCRDRHCPKCQGILSRKWVEERKAELLPVPYFHLVFTVPSGLDHLMLTDARRFLNVLFEAMSEALLKLFLEKHGAVPMVTSVLHTWGSTMCLHPHLHCVVSGGGLTPDGRWIDTGAKWLLDVRELSARFRDAFARLLKKRLPGHSIPAEEFERDWVVHCKEPFAGPEIYIEYIGRYTHRAAISNGRIIDFDPASGMVTLAYKDYRDLAPDGRPKIKPMELHALEFIRRFLLHVLPEGFKKIRFHGLSAGKKRKENIAACRRLFGLPTAQEPASKETEARECPKCGGGMARVMKLPPSSSPPIIFRNEKWRKAA